LFYILLLPLPIFILFKALIYFFLFNSFYSRLLKTKKWSFFFSAYLFGFLLFDDSSSHCVSLTSSHLLFFFVLCLFLNFLVINELTLHVVQIFLPRFGWCYFLELLGLKWRVSKHARVLKTKNRSFIFFADLFKFLLFVDSSSHCVSLTSSHMLFFFVLCLFLNFLVINELTLHILLIF